MWKKIWLLYWKIVPKFIPMKETLRFNSLWAAYKFIYKRISWSDIDRGDWGPIKKDLPLNNCIFVYWKQGFENAPEIVMKCVKSIKANAGLHKVILLSDDNIKEYVRIPDHIETLLKQKKMAIANYSDIVRTDLLIRYGGIWCDSTCFLTESFPKYVENEPIFLFNTLASSKFGTPSKCSNWFIKANQGNIVLKKIQNFLNEYYKHYNFPCAYLIWHYTLSALIESNSECRKIWDNKPYVCNVNPHLLQKFFKKEFSEKNYEYVLKGSFVHKLSYKFDRKKTSPNSYTYYDHFMKS